MNADTIKLTLPDRSTKEVAYGEKASSLLKFLNAPLEEIFAVKINNKVYTLDKRIKYNAKIEPVLKDSKEGIIDIDENIIVPFKYGFKRDKCLSKDGTIPARRRINGKLKWGLINLEDEVLIDFKFDILMPFNDREYTLAIANNKWMFVNKKGEILKIDIDNYVTK